MAHNKGCAREKMASHNLHQQTSYSVMHFQVSSNWAKTDLMGDYLKQQGDVARMKWALMMSRSQGVLLASAAGVAVKLVQQLYHLERHRFPASTSDMSMIKLVNWLSALTIHLHTNVTQITSKFV